MSVLVLVFGVVYPLIALAVICSAVFGIATAMPELRKAAARFERASSYHSYAGYMFRHLAGRAGTAALAGILWPVAIPIWIAWRKGSFVADTVEQRQQVIDRAVNQ